MTEYQNNVANEINREIKARRAERVAEFGPGYVDTIYYSPNKHGRGKGGYHCEFSGFQTGVSGAKLIDFAKKHFGSGKLREMPRQSHWQSGTRQWAVIK
jgi:hypothetical protein